MYKISLLSDDDKKSSNSDEKHVEEKKNPFGWSLRSEKSKSFTEALGFSHSSPDGQKRVSSDSKDKEKEIFPLEELTIMAATCGTPLRLMSSFCT